MKKIWFIGLSVMMVLISGCTFGPETHTISQPTSVPTVPIFTVRSTAAPETYATPVTSVTPATPATFSVEISGFTFNPATVTIPKGSTVIWTQRDSVAHTVTSTRGMGFDSGPLNQGQTFKWTFNEAGTFEYICSIHQYMTGKVIVT